MSHFQVYSRSKSSQKLKGVQAEMDLYLTNIKNIPDDSMVVHIGFHVFRYGKHLKCLLPEELETSRVRRELFLVAIAVSPKPKILQFSVVGKSSRISGEYHRFLVRLRQSDKVKKPIFLADPNLLPTITNRELPNVIFFPESSRLGFYNLSRYFFKSIELDLEVQLLYNRLSNFGKKKWPEFRPVVKRIFKYVKKETNLSKLVQSMQVDFIGSRNVQDFEKVYPLAIDWVDHYISDVL